MQFAERTVDTHDELRNFHNGFVMQMEISSMCEMAGDVL
jgi:hypothetical protein